ncbi:MAG: aminotransferase class III-fold pyridoxal phosphate-dependent enzyme, partial [Pseudomonadota bacterium]
GGGFPLGAVMATNEAAKGMVPGTHGSTFGGNPLGVAVGCAVLSAVTKDGFLEEVQQKASRLRQALAELEDKHPDMIEEVRGLGLLTGLKLKPAVGDVVNACFDEKLLTVPAGDNVIRLIPPLNVSNEELADAVRRIGKAFEKVRQK